MMKLVVCCLLVSLSLSFAAIPVPKWPTSFSSSVLVSRSDSRQPYFYRWFSDSKMQAGRRDGIFEPSPGVLVFATEYRNYSAKTDTRVTAYDDVVTCQVGANPRPYPNPDFSNYNYMGPALIGYQTVYRWALRNGTTDVFTEYFVDANTDPVRFVLAEEGRFETWTFIEFDAGAQDPDLFVIPSVIKSICVNAPTPPPRTTTSTGRIHFN